MNLRLENSMTQILYFFHNFLFREWQMFSFNEWQPLESALLFQFIWVTFLRLNLTKRMNNNKFYDKNKKKRNFCVPTLVFIYDVWMKNRKKKLSVLRKLRSFSGLAGTKYTRDLYISANDELLFIKNTLFLANKIWQRIYAMAPL